MKWQWMLLLSLALGASQTAWSQDDRPWWRQLFGQSTPQAETASPEPIVSPDHPAYPAEALDAEDSVNPAEEDLPVSTLEQPDMPVDSPLSRGGIQGTANWSVPDEIAALDSALTPAEDIRIPGFRVQLFMGRLDSARALRQSLVEDMEWDGPVYVTPYPPLFGVTVGNFTERLPAHRAKEALRSRFPTCLVVPLDLPLDEVYPTGSKGVRGPGTGALRQD